MTARAGGVVVRRFTPGDVDAMVAIRAEMLRDSPFAFLRSPGEKGAVDRDEFARRLASENNGTFGAFAGAGAVVAVASIHCVPIEKVAHRATVTGVYTQPAWRRRGLSRALVEECLGWARSKPGIEQVHLSVHAGNAHALALYEDLGFVRWGVEPRALRVDGVYADEIHLTRML